jgi:hypothetical protein
MRLCGWRSLQVLRRVQEVEALGLSRRSSSAMLVVGGDGIMAGVNDVAIQLERARGAAHGLLLPGGVRIIDAQPRLIFLFASMMLVPGMLFVPLAAGVSLPIALGVFGLELAALLWLRRRWLRRRVPVHVRVRREADVVRIQIGARGRHTELQYSAPSAILSWSRPVPEALKIFGSVRCLGLLGEIRSAEKDAAGEEVKTAEMSAIYWSCDHGLVEQFESELAAALGLRIERAP